MQIPEAKFDFTFCVILFALQVLEKGLKLTLNDVLSRAELLILEYFLVEFTKFHLVLVKLIQHGVLLFFNFALNESQGDFNFFDGILFFILVFSQLCYLLSQFFVFLIELLFEYFKLLRYL